MGRWQPDARGRLAQAALDLYAERGFEQTTVAEIAERAGLTERTFFRHFADKREVLFGGSEELQEHMVRAVLEAPESAAPIDAVGAAVQVAATELQKRREFSLRRQAAISANPGLVERELIKLATLASALAEALRKRGTPEPAASLVGEAGIAVFKVSFERWITTPGDPDFPELAREFLAELRTVVAGE